MTSEPNHARSLFLESLEKEPAERAAYLDRECADDPALRQRVEALLRATGQPASGLDHPVVAKAASAANEQTDHFTNCADSDPAPAPLAVGQAEHDLGLKCPGKREDAIQETIAVAWKWFLRATEQGKDVDEFVMALADYAVRHVRSGRKLCGQLKAKDVFSPRAQQKKGFTVEPLNCSTRCNFEDMYANPHGQDHMDALEERLRDNTQSPVFDQAAFRIDYPAWLSQLGARNSEIAKDMALDFGTFELSSKHKVSAGRISQMRREFCKDWLRFHGEPC